MTLIKKIKQKKTDPKSQFMIKRLFCTIGKPISWLDSFFCSEHNSLKSRYIRLASLRNVAPQPKQQS